MNHLQIGSQKRPIMQTLAFTILGKVS